MSILFSLSYRLTYIYYIFSLSTTFVIGSHSQHLHSFTNLRLCDSVGVLAACLASNSLLFSLSHSDSVCSTSFYKLFVSVISKENHPKNLLPQPINQQPPIPTTLTNRICRPPFENFVVVVPPPNTP